MEDRKFEVYQELRGKVLDALNRAKYTDEDIEDFLRMLKEDITDILPIYPEKFEEGDYVVDRMDDTVAGDVIKVYPNTVDIMLEGEETQDIELPKSRLRIIEKTRV